MLLVRDIAMPLNFTGAQRRNESWEKRKFPEARMGMASQLRQAFMDAQDYQQKAADYEKKRVDAERDKKPLPATPKRDLKLEALLPYLQGKKPVVLAAEGPSDLETAVRLAQEFNLKIVLNQRESFAACARLHCWTQVPVIVGPIYETPKESERFDTVYRLPAELYKRGSQDRFRQLRRAQCAELALPGRGFAVGFGLPPDEALKAITLNAAEISGDSPTNWDRSMWEKPQISLSQTGIHSTLKTDVKHVFIAGQEIPLVSRQTRLRDRVFNEVIGKIEGRGIHRGGQRGDRSR